MLFLGSDSVYVGGAATLTVALLGPSMTCFAGSGAEHFEATSGALSLSYANAASAVSFTALGTSLIGHGAAAGDELTAITSLTLTAFADIIDMTSFFATFPTEIYAGNGNDKVKLLLDFAQMVDAGGGKDKIDGVLSSGRVAGGGGNDTIDLTGTGFLFGSATVTGGSGTDVVSLEGYGQTIVDLGTGNDKLTFIGIGNTVADLLCGLGDDTVTGLVTSGSVDGGAGNDGLHFDLITTLGSLAALLGGAGDDALSVTVTGASGEAAVAFLNEGLGNDGLIKTSLLSDNMVTTFVFDAGWGDDAVTGFLDGTDLVELHATGATTFADLTVSGDATHTLVSFGTDSFDLIGLNSANFSAADVMFAA